MSQKKIGENVLSNMIELGFFEARNLASFEGSNIQDDIRRTGRNQEQEVFHYHIHDQQQDQALELQQEQ